MTNASLFQVANLGLCGRFYNSKANRWVNIQKMNGIVAEVVLGFAGPSSEEAERSRVEETTNAIAWPS